VKIKKVFISLPMNGKTEAEIKENRQKAIEALYSLGYTEDELSIIDTFIKEDAPDDVNDGLWYLGKSIELLAGADLVVFAPGWRAARGCVIEFKCAREYGLSCITA